MRHILSAMAMLAVISAPVAAKSLDEAIRENQPDEKCISTGTVFRLDPRGDNNLSVRVQPRALGPRYEKDELFTGEHVCVTRTDGVWAFVIYHRNGRAFSGWVHGHYIHVDEDE